MMKPLSPNTLEKKYAELGLSQDRIDLLHDYFLCYSNLYGVISVGDAWSVFREYEGIRLLHKKDFIAFSGIVQREPGHPYTVLELKEVYTGETTEDPAQRLIVNNRLIGTGYHKYVMLYKTVERQMNRPYYLPAERTAFLANTEDGFFLSPDGKKMVRFLGRLRTDGKYRGYDGKPCGEILDLDGNPAAGKRLSDFACYTQFERLEIDYVKSEAKKEKLRREYKKTALDKILDYIFMQIQTGGYLPDQGPAETMRRFVDFLSQKLGVEFTAAQMQQFFELYVNLNNRSHLWQNCGWQPDELARRGTSGLPETISIGPNMKKLFEEGEMDQAAFEQQLKKLGIKLSEE